MKKVIVAMVAVMFTSCSVFSPKNTKNSSAPKESSASQSNAKGSKMVLISTNYGDIKIRLYDETPLHRDNFVKLVESGFYNDLLFHRVIQGFMIQGGDPNSKTASPGVALGSGGGDMERIPAEFNPALHHKKGALAAARDGNPQKASSACQFYIVQGKTYTDQELDGLQSRAGITYTEQQRNDYKTIGGTAFLDMNYTVFGEVVSGLEVVDKIAAVATNKSIGDRPLEDVRMRIKMVK
ncbi:MAG: peptidylprolyl isomerase [Arcticibacter sp.]